MTWRCERCESIYETNDPPCDTCGSDELVSASATSSAERVTSFVWACTECGREHVKNSPPCSRCGHPMLERSEPTYDDADPEVSGYVGVIKPYAPVLLLFLVVIGLTGTGIVTLDMLPGHGPPSPPDAPGADAQTAGIDFEGVESEVHERLQAERDRRGVPSREYDDRLALLAEYMNKQRVVAYHDGTSVGSSPDASDFDLDCSGSSVYVQPYVLGTDVEVTQHEDESSLASDITEVLGSEEYEDVVFDPLDAEALDVHVGEDDTVFVFYATC